MNPASQLEPLDLIETQSGALFSAGDWRHTILIRGWNALKWIAQRVRVKPASRNLRVCENVSLGEKRFVAVVEVDGERFLIGGSSSSVSLLTRLQEAKTFASDLERAAEKIS